MSVKAALAKLSATAAGGALLAGGAVHVAEKPVTDAPSYKSIKGAKTQPRMIKQAKATPRAPRPAPPPRAAVTGDEGAQAHGEAVRPHDHLTLLGHLIVLSQEIA